MTLDMIEILLDVAVRMANIASETEQAIFLLFIVMVIIIGSVWAISIMTTAWLANQARLFFINA